MRAYHQPINPGEDDDHAAQRRREPILRQHVLRAGQQVEERREGENTVAPAEDRGDVEGGEADGENVDPGRKDARPGKRQRNRPHDAAGACAAHLRRFLKRGIHRAEYRGRHDKREWRQIEPLNPAHAENTRYIERRLGEAERPDQERIEKADAWMHQEQPAHRSGKARHQQTDGHQCEDNRLARQIRPLDQPCGRNPKEEGDGKRSKRKAQRVPKHFVGPGVQRHRHVVAERVDVLRVGFSLDKTDPEDNAEARKDDDAHREGRAIHDTRQSVRLARETLLFRAERGQTHPWAPPEARALRGLPALRSTMRRYFFALVVRILMAARLVLVVSGWAMIQSVETSVSLTPWDRRSLTLLAIREPS